MGIGELASLEDLQAREQDPLGWLIRVMSETEMAFPRAKAIGFKLHIRDRLSVIGHLLTQTDMPLIVLDRENRLAQYASWAQTLETRRYTHRNRGRRPAAPLDFSREDFLAFVTRQSLAFGLVESLINDRSRLLHVDYKEVNEPECHNRVLRFLGVHEAKLEGDEERLGSPRIRSRFADPEDVASQLDHTVWRRWLERDYG